MVYYGLRLLASKRGKESIRPKAGKEPGIPSTFLEELHHKQRGQLRGEEETNHSLN